MKNTLNIGGKIMGLTQPIVMGILNSTPDSFYKDSRINSCSEEFLKKAGEMLAEGVTILDIGGYSTRPGGENIDAAEEAERILPVIKSLRRHFPDAALSVDTFRAEVARQAYEEGADIINDISGGSFDAAMFPFIIQTKMPYILMHLEGTVESMHKQEMAEDFLTDLSNKLLFKANFLRKNGVTDIILDPGIGFSKTVNQNFKLIDHLQELCTEHYPLLIGLSRKSLIHKTLKIKIEESLPFTMALNLLSLYQGAKIIRVHDVKEHLQIIELYRNIKF